MAQSALFFCFVDYGSFGLHIIPWVGSRIRRNCSGSEIGGWQLNPEQTTAADFPSLITGKCGMVSANPGGRFCGTASFAANLSTDLWNPKTLVATAKSCS